MKTKTAKAFKFQNIVNSLKFEAYKFHAIVVADIIVRSKILANRNLKYITFQKLTVFTSFSLNEFVTF